MCVVLSSMQCSYYNNKSNLLWFCPGILDLKNVLKQMRPDFSLVPLWETTQYRTSLTQLTDCVVSSNFGTRLDTEGAWQGHGVVVLWEARGKSSCPCLLPLCSAAGKVVSLLLPPTNADPVDQRWQLSISCNLAQIWKNLNFLQETVHLRIF